MRHLRLPNIYWKSYPLYRNHSVINNPKITKNNDNQDAASSISSTEIQPVATAATSKLSTGNSLISVHCKNSVENKTETAIPGRVLRSHSRKQVVVRQQSPPISLQKRQKLWISAKNSRFKCPKCRCTQHTKKDMLAHLSEHADSPLCCRTCRRTFTGTIPFNWHLKWMCKRRILSVEHKLQCTQCSQTFRCKRHLDIHLAGHKRNNCTYCDQVMTTRGQLVRHLVQAHCIKLQRNVHKCEHCEKCYLKRISLYYHMQQQHYSDRYVCLECGHISDDALADGQHKYQHLVAKRFRCQHCGERFARRQQFIVHLNRHGQFRCNTCNLNCASLTQLLHHKRRGHQVVGADATVAASASRYTCQYCACVSASARQLAQHLRRQHATENIGPHLHRALISCTSCQRSFCSPFAYYKHCSTQSHEKKCNLDVRPTQCGLCSKTFMKRCHLRQHIYRNHRHIAKEAIQCAHCAYRTPNKYNMQRHLQLHARRMEYTCEHCGRTCDNLAALKDHILYKHVQQRDFKCTECGRAFKRKSELVRHQVTHTKERQFECTTCGKLFTRGTNLKRHEKNVHSGGAAHGQIQSAAVAVPSSSASALLHDNLLLNLDTNDALNIVDQLVCSFLPPDGAEPQELFDVYSDFSDTDILGDDS